MQVIGKNQVKAGDRDFAPKGLFRMVTKIDGKRIHLLDSEDYPKLEAMAFSNVFADSTWIYDDQGNVMVIVAIL